MTSVTSILLCGPLSSHLACRRQIVANVCVVLLQTAVSTAYRVLLLELAACFVFHLRAQLLREWHIVLYNAGRSPCVHGAVLSCGFWIWRLVAMLGAHCLSSCRYTVWVASRRILHG